VSRTPVAAAVALVALAGACTAGVLVGPVDISLGAVVGTLLSHVPLVHFHSRAPAVDQAIVWNLRAPRVALGCLVGGTLAAGGASYQGVFRNQLADPDLLGVAAGAGLGATLVIVANGSASNLLPLAAFLGAVAAVTLTYLVGASGGGRPSGRSIVLAGVAVAALLTALQTYIQQDHTQQVQQIYLWLLGSLSLASWSQVVTILPYVAVSGAVLLAHHHTLDVLRVGEEEATSLGVHVGRTRLLVVAAATLGTAAAVSVSGLIGFVGIIVPHLVRRTVGASYKIVMPLSMLGGAALLVLADLAARTVEAPAEIPIGVVTAIIGAPFFLFVLRSRRAHEAAL
jgi:iron complex transport system permease protein